MSRRPPRQPRVSRAVRGVLLAVVSSALAIGAHGAAGGGVPDAASTVLLTALVGYVAAALAERTAGFTGVLAVLGTGQLVMHLLLTELGEHGHGQTSGGPLMTVTHALATLIAAAMLTRAEHALRVAAARLRPPRPRAWHDLPVPPAPPARIPAAPPVIGHVTTVLLREVCARRGPPLPS